MNEQQTAPDVPRWLVNQWDHQRRRMEAAAGELARIDERLATPELADAADVLVAAERRVAELRHAAKTAAELRRVREAKSRELDNLAANVDHLRISAENLCAHLGIEVPPPPADAPLDDTAAQQVQADPLAPHAFNVTDGRGENPPPILANQMTADMTRAGAYQLPAPPPAPTLPDGPNGGDQATGRFQAGGDRRA